jgi:hypothetical protein
MAHEIRGNILTPASKQKSPSGLRQHAKSRRAKQNAKYF